MFGKDKRNLDPKMAFMFGLVSGVAILAVIISLVLIVVKTDGADSDQVAVDGNNNVNSNTNTAPTPTPPPSRPPASVGAIAGKVKDNPNAKVTIEIFDDFECPYCLRHTNTVSQMLDEYGDQINLVFKHFPLSFHQNAQKAAEAYECAKEQNKGWEMHDKIFEAQATKTMGVSTFKSDAAKLGLDSSKFDSCLDSDKYADKIAQDQAEGSQKGVRGTPATFINGEMVSGAIPYATLKAAIEKNL